jgi:Zn finger protein HypA/HybF involved in hydrogenase expression
MATQIQIERPRPRRHDPARVHVEEDFDRIKCRDCGRSYPALDGPALLYSLKATCPHCGGGFELAL